MSLLFNQPCPTCGRKQKIRIELLGRTVACQHCRAEFTASDRSDAIRVDADHHLMSRVERALQMSQAAAIPTETAMPVE